MINGLYVVLINGIPKIKHKDAIDVSTPHALADLVAAVCSETEADTKIGNHAGVPDAHHTPVGDYDVYPNTEEVAELPAADAAHNGRIYRLRAGADNVTHLYICLQSRLNTYIWLNITSAYILLTVADFQANAATGTVSEPARLNDNNPALSAIAGVVNQYAEVDFGNIFRITEFRSYGDSSNTGEDGYWKIQHWDGEGWVDNTVNIPTRKTETFTDWIPLAEAVSTTKIRFVCTLLDHSANSYIGELEMRG